MIVLNEQVADPENVRENFKKIGKAINSGLPDQAGHAGKYLYTNGSVASWQVVFTNIDGGFAAETYLSFQKADGGSA